MQYIMVKMKATFFETHFNLFASSIINLYDFSKSCADTDDSECLDDKVSASNIYLLRANQINSNTGPGNSCFVLGGSLPWPQPIYL
jgi:hypothetical protein